MFRASSCPSTGATTTAVAASCLPSELGDSSAVDCGQVKKFCVFLEGSKEDIFKCYLQIIYRTLMYYFYVASNYL